MLVKKHLSNLVKEVGESRHLSRVLERIRADVSFEPPTTEDVEFCFSYEKPDLRDSDNEVLSSIKMKTKGPPNTYETAHHILYTALTDCISSRALQHLLSVAGGPIKQYSTDDLKCAINEYLENHLPIQTVKEGVDAAYINPLTLVKLVVGLADWSKIEGREVLIVHSGDGRTANKTQSIMISLKVFVCFLFVYLLID